MNCYVFSCKLYEYSLNELKIILATTVFDSASGARHEVVKADLIGIFLAVFVFNYLLEI